jgi:RNA polymerase sigma-70 factor (ECF subfamily)
MGFRIALPEVPLFDVTNGWVRINRSRKAMKPLVLAQSPPDMDRNRFSELIRDHHRPLLAYARVLAGHPDRARELVQDAFVAAWQTIGRFDVTRDFGSWLRGIVRNKWREDCRKHRREVPLEEPELAAMEDAVRAWTAGRGEAGLLERLAECRAKLPELLSQAVTAYYDEKRDGEGAAALLGIASSTFRKRLERARDALRLCLETQN